MNKKIATLVAAAAICAPAFAQPVSVLFVGNSYTFGRVDPVMSYNTAGVDDMTRPRPDLPDPNFTDTAGTRVWEPHPWGGVPGIFKQLTVQAGLDYAVSMSARNAASLRGHYLNTANADWDLRGNIAKQKWDVVVLQEQSDASLPEGPRRQRQLPAVSAPTPTRSSTSSTSALADVYRERAMYAAIYGSVANCVAGRGTQPSATTTRATIPANPNASALTKVYLTQTWARPDMVFPHLSTIADANYPTPPDGRPIIDTLGGTKPDGYPDTLYYTDTGLAGMTADLRAAFANKAMTNPQLRRGHPGRRCVPARARRQRREGRRLLQRAGNLRSGGPAGQDQPVVGRLPAREPPWLLPERAGHLRHADGRRPRLVRREREGRGGSRHQPRRRREAAARGLGSARSGGPAADVGSLPARQSRRARRRPGQPQQSDLRTRPRQVASPALASAPWSQAVSTAWLVYGNAVCVRSSRMTD